MESSPPYLVVHANAASIQLADFGPSSIVGKPISALLSIVETVPNTNKKVSRKTSATCEPISEDVAKSSSKHQQKEPSPSEHTLAKISPSQIFFDALVGLSDQTIPLNEITNDKLNQCYAVTLKDKNQIEEPKLKNSLSIYGNPDVSTCLMSICPVERCKAKLKEELITTVSSGQLHTVSLGRSALSKKRKHRLQLSCGLSLKNKEQASHRSNIDKITHYVIQLLPANSLTDCRSHSDGTTSFIDPSPVTACG